jgi:hypothetical protein
VETSAVAQGALQHEVSAPRPPVILVVVSLVVIAAALIFASAAFAGFWEAWDPCALVTAVFFTPAGVSMAIAQHGATFRRWRTAAIWCAMILLCGAAMMALALVAMPLEIIAAGKRPPLDPLIHFLGVFLLGLLGSWTNFRWYRTLRPFDEPVLIDWRLSLRELLGLVAAAGLCVAVVNYAVQQTMPQYAEHLETAPPLLDLPAGATDISYCRGIRGVLLYEFTTDETTFRDWAAATLSRPWDEQVTLEEAAPFKMVQTYRVLKNPANEPDYVTITDGLVCGFNDTGYAAGAAYDRATGRAYYWSLPD